jgi:hypothetical protein
MEKTGQKNIKTERFVLSMAQSDLVAQDSRSASTRNPQPVGQYQTTNEFYQRYARRAGIEGTLSQGVRAFSLRRSRYIGLAKTHFQHLVTAVAMNLVRLTNWWQGIPKAPTRISRFATLAPTQTVS